MRLFIQVNSLSKIRRDSMPTTYWNVFFAFCFLCRFVKPPSVDYCCLGCVTLRWKCNELRWRTMDWHVLLQQERLSTRMCQRGGWLWCRKCGTGWWTTKQQRHDKQEIEVMCQRTGWHVTLECCVDALQLEHWKRWTMVAKIFQTCGASELFQRFNSCHLIYTIQVNTQHSYHHLVECARFAVIMAAA